MPRRVQIELDTEDQIALHDMAKKELRDLRNQALHLVRKGLRKNNRFDSAGSKNETEVSN